MTPIRDPMLWWVTPRKLAGMPMPLVDAWRSENSGQLNDYDDDLPALWLSGIRTVISLLNIPQHQRIYEDAGFRYLSSPILDMNPPEIEQMDRIVEFYSSSPPAVAVHCQAGLGRTGTVLASCLISQGLSADQAIDIIREAQPGAIETQSQISFLHDYYTHVNGST